MSADIVQKINRLMQKGDFAAARKRVVPLLKKHPRNAALQNVAGICSAQSVSNAAALPYFAAAAKLDPGNVDYRCNLALALVHLRKTDEAQAQIDKLKQQAPSDYRPHQYSALLARAANDYKAIVAHATRTLEHAPDLTEALMLRASAYTDLQDVTAALEDYRRVVDLKPGNANTLKALARHLSAMGERGAALVEYYKILAIDPLDAFAISQFVQLCPEDRLDEARSFVETLTANLPRTARGKGFAALAEANLAKRDGNEAEAMAHFARMHRIDAKAMPWNPKPGWREFEQIKRVFPSGDALPALPRPTTPRPIFIVGLPRSGTTLLEMSLGAATNVVPCGELRGWARDMPRLLESTGISFADRMEDLAKSYRAGLPELPPGTEAFIDKMPTNYRYVGPLLTAFPEARVINLCRDPRDVALSMWTRRFRHPAMNYTNRLEWIADQANLYRSYMAHWHRLYADQILSIDYEELVRDMQACTRRLAEHCGVAWSEAMLAPEKNTSQVRTASLWQVREKVHTSSIGGWHAFGDHITELTGNLDPALWPEFQ